MIPEYVLGFTIAFFIGIIASVFGIGGGVLYVPTLTLIFGLDPKIAIGTSLAIIVFSSLTGTITYRQQGRIFYKSAVVIILPSIACSIIGSLATAYIPGEILTLLFAGFLLIIALHILVPEAVRIPMIGSGPCFDDRCVDCYQNVIQVRPNYLHLMVWGAIGGFLGGISGIGGGSNQCPCPAFRFNARSFRNSDLNPDYFYNITLWCARSFRTWTYQHRVSRPLCNRIDYRGIFRGKYRTEDTIGHFKTGFWRMPSFNCRNYGVKNNLVNTYSFIIQEYMPLLFLTPQPLVMIASRYTCGRFIAQDDGRHIVKWRDPPVFFKKHTQSTHEK